MAYIYIYTRCSKRGAKAPLISRDLPSLSRRSEVPKFRCTEIPPLRPKTAELKPKTPELKHETPELKPETPKTPELKPETSELKPETPELKPETPNRAKACPS